MSKKQQLLRYLSLRSPGAIGESEWRELLRTFAPISETYLRKLLHDSGARIEQPYDGVRQATFEELERSLVDLEKFYERAKEAGDRERARYARRQVIRSKDHARFVARHPKTSAEKKTEKEEMIQWMLVWLENPGVFPAWVEARKRARTAGDKGEGG